LGESGSIFKIRAVIRGSSNRTAFGVRSCPVIFTGVVVPRVTAIGCVVRHSGFGFSGASAEAEGATE
jgi:hypothetical protein